MVAGFGRFDDLTTGSALIFDAPHRLLTANSLDEVVPVLQAVSDLTEAGAWAYGYVGYDGAPAFDPLLTVVPAPPQGPAGPPLAWFAISDAPESGPVIGVAVAESTWAPAWSDRDYDAAIALVQSHIAAGDTYQVNLTSRLLGTVADPLALYASLIHQQRGAHAGYLDLGSHRVASASPELFFSWDGSQIVTRPMKGTARRGRTTVEDRAFREHLLASEKERAEHIIVVDLLRNDLGRVAAFGSVTTPHLGVTEQYESVWQLTSDVIARTRDGVTLVDVLRALFPCGSVTGAPKRRTMQIIADVEPVNRGVYCGAIGVVAPPGADAPRAEFSVAIRTAVIAADGSASYGVGGGITAGSVAGAEREELQAKSLILFGRHEEFLLLETMHASPAGGIRNRELHLERLADSAGYFEFPFPAKEISRKLEAVVADADVKLRLTLSRDGTVEVTSQSLQAVSTGPVRLAVDSVPVDPTQRWLFHKTTNRRLYEEAAARHRDADDVVLVNDQGFVTETTIANIAAFTDGTWWTPPVGAGCLPGVERGRLVAAGSLVERDLTVEELRTADELAVVSSLRGWRAAELVRR